MLSRLIYASKASSTVDFPQVRAINEASVKRNTEDGITGLLIFGTSTFLQILEGDRAKISRTFDRISRDRRHESALLIDVTEIVERDFNQWAMKLVCLDPNLSPRTAPVLRRFGVSDQFEPSDLSAASALHLLKAMADMAGDGS